MERSIAQQLAAAFNLNKEQAEQYSNRYSNSVLQKALQSFQKQTKKISNPQAWLAWVTADEERKENEKTSHFPKKGRMDDFQKKIVHGTFNANHSPEAETSKVSKEERITFVLKEIANYEKVLKERREWVSKLPGGEHLIAIAQNSIANYKRELTELHYSPDTIICPAPRERINDPAELEHRVGDREYEQHLQEISKDKSDHSGYKEMVRRYDYRRIAR